jgi:hypothetical protein
MTAGQGATTVEGRRDGGPSSQSSTGSRLQITWRSTAML